MVAQFEGTLQKQAQPKQLSPWLSCSRSIRAPSGILQHTMSAQDVAQAASSASRGLRLTGLALSRQVKQRLQQAIVVLTELRTSSMSNVSTYCSCANHLRLHDDMLPSSILDLWISLKHFNWSPQRCHMSCIAHDCGRTHLCQAVR